MAEGRRPRGAGSIVLGALASRKAAVAVMGLLAGILALASLVPAPNLDDPAAAARLAEERPVLSWLQVRLNPEELVGSKPFLLLPAYLFLAIGLSIVQRVKLHLRAHELGFEREVERFRVERRLVLPMPPEAASARIEAALRHARYELGPARPGELRGRRGRHGFYGSIAFHLGLILVLAGVVASAATRVSGELLLTEGFPAAFVSSSFTRVWGAERMPEWPDRALEISDFVAEYSRSGTPMQFAMLLSVLGEGETEQAVVRVNEPFVWRRFNFTLHRYGFAPELAVVDERGVVQAEGVAPLRLIPPGTEDSLPLEDGGSIRFRFYPDFVEGKAGPASASLSPRRPVLLFSWLGPDGAPVAEGRVRLGERAMVAGREVRFSSLSYWGDFLVTRDEGVLFLFLGSLVGCLGLVLRFLQPDQTFKATLSSSPEGTTVHLLAGTRFFPALHEEFVESFAGSLESGAGGQAPKSRSPEKSAS